MSTETAEADWQRVLDDLWSLWQRLAIAGRGAAQVVRRDGARRGHSAAATRCAPMGRRPQPDVQPELPALAWPSRN